MRDFQKLLSNVKHVADSLTEISANRSSAAGETSVGEDAIATLFERVFKWFACVPGAMNLMECR